MRCDVCRPCSAGELEDLDWIQARLTPAANPAVIESPDPLVSAGSRSGVVAL